MVSTAAKADLRCGHRIGGLRGAGGGLPTPRVVLDTILTAGLESVQQLGLMASIEHSDGRTGGKRDMAMELRHLDTLLAIAEQGSFTAAADALSTVQSNVSEQVRQLEDELGADLLVRGRRGATPTECGEVVLERARRIRRELDAMQADLSMLQGLRTGHASLGIVGTASRWMIPTLVADLRAEAPGVQLRINEGASERLASEVLAGELSLAVITEPMTSPRLDVEHLLDETLVGLVPAEATEFGPDP